MDTDSCTAPCLNARGVWILTRQGTGSRGTTAPAAPRRWVHRSRRGPPSKTGAPAARVLCAPAWPPSCRCESRIPPQQPYSQVADCQLSRPRAGGFGIAKADLNTYDRATSATRLQSCFHRRWRDVTSRRHIHLYTFVHIATEKIPNCNRVPRSPRYGSKTYVMVPKRTIWLQNRRFGSKTAAEKTHPSTLLPLGTTGQDETALQDDRPAACVST